MSARAWLPILCLALIVGLLLGLSACNRPDAPVAGQHLRIALGANPSTLDPHRATSTADEAIVANLFVGLTEYDPRSVAPVPELAERWQMSDDATTFTFYLRRDARWSNGDPVTAHDFVYSWRRILDSATASEYASMLYPIRHARAVHQGRLSSASLGVEALDEHTLRVTMERPTAYFLQLTSHWAFRLVHRPTVERWGDQWTKPEHLVVNGPFLLAEWKPNETLTLKKNPTYWDADYVKLERATFYLSEDTTALLNLYRVGEIDTMVSGLLPVQQIPLLRQQDDYVSGPFLSLYHYLLNVTKPPLSRLEVRQALNLSLNRPQICHRVLQAGQQPASGLTPGDFGGQYPRPPGPSFDLPAAKELMSKAGYPEGRGLRLRLIFSSLDVHRQLAEAAQAQWRAAFPHIQIELASMEWQVFRQARQQRDFDLAMRHWIADYNDPYNFLELMLTNNSNNQTGWSNPNYDQLIEQANATSVPNQRFYLLAQAERLLLEELPFIPIYEGVTFFLSKPYVQGWHTNLLDKHPLKFVRIAK